MDCDYDSESDTPPEVTKRANAAIATIIPGKSKIQNERAYTPFFILVSGRCDQASHG
jgi:hypothetical protein